MRCNWERESEPTITDRVNNMFWPRKARTVRQSHNGIEPSELWLRIAITTG